MINKLHHGISIGIPKENHGNFRVMHAKIGSKRINFTESFDLTQNRISYYPDLFPKKPIKKIYENIYTQIMNGFDDEGANPNQPIGPTKSPGQNFKAFDWRKPRNQIDIIKILNFLLFILHLSSKY